MDCKGIFTPHTSYLGTKKYPSFTKLRTCGGLKKDPFFREIHKAGVAPLCTWVPPPPPRGAINRWINYCCTVCCGRPDYQRSSHFFLNVIFIHGQFFVQICQHAFNDHNWRWNECCSACSNNRANTIWIRQCALWYKTASWLSPLHRFKSRSRHEKVASDLALGGGFR